MRSAAEVLSTRDRGDRSRPSLRPGVRHGRRPAFARRHGLLVVEDAAQAHGARWRGSRAGSLGHVAAFSFYPSKNLGALGDGGAICTDDDAIAERSRRLRDLGQRRKGEHVEAGFNERLDGLQAAMLRIKLRGLDAGNAERRARAALYGELLPEACRPLIEDPRGECVVPPLPGSRRRPRRASRRPRSGRRPDRDPLLAGGPPPAAVHEPAVGRVERPGVHGSRRARCDGARKSCRCRCSPSSGRRRSSGWPRPRGTPSRRSGDELLQRHPARGRAP